ncbi:hypothetical protein [Corynebacterium aquatimens]|uniref:hypothetical protein n=1 Tax=Corynebacterium aquatimens TaxID=1190508 RepID=UPI00331340CE
MAAGSQAMTKVSLRNIGSHKLRLALTVLAVVLGTAFIAGSMMFTNMLERTFDSAVATQYKNADAVVEPGRTPAPCPPTSLRPSPRWTPSSGRTSSVPGRL